MNTYLYCFAGCNEGKLILLSHDEWRRQTKMITDTNWYCPECGGPAERDDENYDERSEEAFI